MKLQYSRWVAALARITCHQFCQHLSDYFSFSWNWLGNKQQRTIKPKRHLWRVIMSKGCEAEVPQYLYFEREDSEGQSLKALKQLQLGFEVNRRCKCVMLSKIRYTVSSTTVKANSKHCTGVQRGVTNILGCPSTYTNNVFTWLYTLLVKITIVRLTGAGAKYGNIQK